LSHGFDPFQRKHIIDSNQGVRSAEGAGLDDHRETVKRTFTEGTQNKSGSSSCPRGWLRRRAHSKAQKPCLRPKERSIRPDIVHDRENEFSKPSQDFLPIGRRGRETRRSDLEHHTSRTDPWQPLGTDPQFSSCLRRMPVLKGREYRMSRRRIAGVLRSGL